MSPTQIAFTNSDMGHSWGITDALMATKQKEKQLKLSQEAWIVSRIVGLYISQ
ncbi:hypothetical protein BgiBS90_026559, partial [Biomphalaria glabrata]